MENSFNVYVFVTAGLDCAPGGEDRACFPGAGLELHCTVPFGGTFFVTTPEIAMTARGTGNLLFIPTLLSVRHYILEIMVHVSLLGGF